MPDHLSQHLALTERRVLSWREAVVGRTVIVREDHNVPLTETGQILDHSRLRSTLRGLESICSRAERTVILTHLGYPSGKRVANLTTRPLFEFIERQISAPMSFCPDPQPSAIAAHLAKIPKGGAVYVENVRFLPGEESCDHKLAGGWGSFADLFVNDAFSVSHRAHASVSGLAQYLPSVLGPTLLEEINSIDAHMQAAKRPGLIIGGAKSRTKLPLVRDLTGRFSPVCVAGLCGAEMVHANLKNFSFGCTVELLTDVRLGDLPGNISSAEMNNLEGLSRICDTGPRTLERFIKRLTDCDLVVWNGPLGAYERPEGRQATAELCRYLVQRRGEGLHLIAGGGDTLASIAMLGFSPFFDRLMGAGGAMLAYLAKGRSLPGLAFLGSSIGGGLYDANHI